MCRLHRNRSASKLPDTIADKNALEVTTTEGETVPSIYARYMVFLHHCSETQTLREGVSRVAFWKGKSIYYQMRSKGDPLWMRKAFCSAATERQRSHRLFHVALAEYPPESLAAYLLNERIIARREDVEMFQKVHDLDNYSSSPMKRPVNITGLVAFLLGTFITIGRTIPEGLFSTRAAYEDFQVSAFYATLAISLYLLSWFGMVWFMKVAHTRLSDLTSIVLCFASLMMNQKQAGGEARGEGDLTQGRLVQPTIDAPEPP